MTLPILMALLLLQDPQDPVDSALEAISKFDYGRAIQILEPLARKSPDRAEVWYLLGYARNRLELWDLAAEALEKARKLGASTPQLSRELGLVELGRRNWDAALALLREAPPDDGEAAFARGQALLALGRNKEALKELSDAARLDERLEPRARLLRATALASLGRVREAQEELERGATKAAGTELEAPYADLLKRLRAIPAPRSGLFYGSASLGIQYNDNVVFLPDDAPRVSEDVTDKEDLLAYARVQLESDLYRTDDFVVGLSGAGYASVHWDLEAFNVLDVFVAARASARLGSFTLGGRAGGGVTWLDESPFRTAWLASVFMGWQPDEDWLLRLEYTFQNRQFLGTTSLDEEDRDGPYHSLRLGTLARFAEGSVTAWLALLGEAGEPEGESVRYRAWGLEAAVTWTFRPEWTLRLGGRLRWIDYTEDNVRTIFTESREDRERVAFVTVAWRFAPSWTLGVDFQHFSNESNLEEFFEFDQNVTGTSLTFEF